MEISLSIRARYDPSPAGTRRLSRTASVMIARSAGD